MLQEQGNWHLHYFLQLVWVTVWGYVSLYRCYLYLHLYQKKNVIVVSVYTNYLCYLGGKGYCQKTIVAMCNSKW